MPQPECLADYACECGEGPLWHPDEQRLYWTDIPTGRMFWYEPATGHHEQCYEGEVVGGFTLQQDGSLLLFMAGGAVRVWRQGFVRTVLEEIPHERDSRFNDVLADRRGRVFCGTMGGPEKRGRLYRLDPGGALEVMLEGLGCPNGMGFSPDGQGFYFTESVERVIYRFDYDEASGALSNQQVFARVCEADGMPDGMTVDAAGHVWSARWDGHCLVEYDDRGRVRQRLVLPARKISSVIFGGTGYNDAYLTTAGGREKAQEGASAGCLLRLRSVAAGVPDFRSAL